MKNALAAVLLVLAFASAKAEGFRAGVRFGMDASQVDGDHLVGFNKAGLLAGLTLERMVSERTSLNMEMIFIQKGSVKPTNPDDNTYYRMRLGYIEVPLLARWSATKKISLEAGPAFGVLVSSRENNELGTLNYAPAFQKMEYSFNTGLDYQLSEQWMVDARYSFSIIPIRDFSDTQVNFYWERGQFNALVQLSLNYRF